MNPQAPTTPSASPNYFSTNLDGGHRNQRGIAIITVLSVLLLMTVLILAFFKMAESELKDARFYSETVRTRQLSEVVTNVVIGQLRMATQKESGGSEKYTWASQPGAITRFKTSLRSSSDFHDMADEVYKLYSAADMVESVRTNVNLANDVPSDWDERTARFVDLNEPVYNSTQDRLYFPIIDPRGYASQSDDIIASNIEGFRYSSTNSQDDQINGVVEPGGNAAHKQRLPMPVEWMYMLADGTLGTVDDQGMWISPYSGASDPTERNPISARVAFWTDDESAKININVASEGAYWDIPRADTPAERNYGRYQPVRNEVYRYPGHVGGISLSTVLFPGTGANEVGADPFLNESQYRQILGISPKVEFHTQGSGIGNRIAEEEFGPAIVATIHKAGDERLYATVDEMLYAASGDANDNGERPINQIFENDRTRQFFEYGRHSLTVNSNAPEITLFGTPRVCLWPMKYSGSAPNGTIRVVAGQTYYDRLISFAATIGQRRYFWQRDNASSRHGEHYNNANGANSELLENYIYQMGETAIPGYGRSFFNKYGSGQFDDGKQIMTQIWDYMRDTNLNDPLLNESLHYNKLINGVGFGQIAGSCRCGGTTAHQQVWWQILAPYPKGHGRLYVPTEVAMVFYARGENTGQPGAPLGDSGDLLDPGERHIEVGLLVETFCVSMGFRSIQPNSRLVVVGNFQGGVMDPSPESFPDYFINGKEFPPLTGSENPTGAHLVTRSSADNGPDEYVNQRPWGGHGGVRLFNTALNGSDAMVFRSEVEESNDSKVLNKEEALIIPISNGTMTFQGSPDPMAIIFFDDRRSLNVTSTNRSIVNNLVQVFEIAFDHPDSSQSGQPFPIPAPRLATNGLHTWEARVREANTDPTALIQPEDVTRSVQVAHGDFRIISGRRVGLSHHFAPHPDFGSATVRHAHTLTDSDGTKLHGFNAKRGFAVDQAGNPITYPEAIAPDFPGGLGSLKDDDSFFPKETRAAQRYELEVDPGITGDWDTGIGAHIDGAYINRPDDGVQLAGGGGIPYFDQLDEPDEVRPTYFAPNRIINGPGQLGSISTGTQAEIPWRTLLFRPDAEHFGARDYPSTGSPPDHVIMDFFWMPLVEPFPISQPFSTMGKVNMNYRIVPFDYINRATAMHATMKDQRMMAIENNAVNSYKTIGGSDYRYPINIPATLKQFEDRFDNGEIFRSATEICEIYMVPDKPGAPTRATLGEASNVSVGGEGLDYPSMRDFWKDHALTADNVKERTYANLYPRLTTKSNVFQTHMIVESILKARSVPHDVFDPERDQISGRWRGSAVIERNIDPAKINPGPGSVPDYWQDNQFRSLPSMEEFYNYRVLNVKQFNP